MVQVIDVIPDCSDRAGSIFRSKRREVLGAVADCIGGGLRVLQSLCRVREQAKIYEYIGFAYLVASVFAFFGSDSPA